jgi:hypothetical protein
MADTQLILASAKHGCGLLLAAGVSLDLNGSVRAHVPPAKSRHADCEWGWDHGALVYSFHCGKTIRRTL